MTGLAAGAISLAGVGKRYTKYEDTPSMVYGVLRAFGRTKTSDLWAVRGVELEIRPGESVGIIGTNGSGKSTLLQMLCGVTSPTEGSVRVGGRIAPLISVGVGFHPELTGRENVYVNGAILGLSPQDIDARFDDIVAFAGIGDFIETPVKFYSSGMYVRLGFSVAAHVDPDVLLLDEVLAVGDLAFQLRCFEHLRVLRERGTTVVMVSHNMPSVEGFCDRGVLMRKGRILHDGPVRDAVESYHKVMASDGNQEGLGLLGEGIEPGTAEVLGMTISDADGVERFHFDAGETAVVDIEIRALRDIRAPFLYVAVTSDTGAVVYAEQNIFDPFPSLRAGQQSRMSFRLPLRLATGAYTVRTSVGRANDAEVEQIQNADDAALLSPPQTALLYVQGRHTVDGVADLGGEFRVADRFLGQS